jgi:uncharacterized protein
MDNIPYTIQKIINEYLDTLNRNNIQIQQAILYGSYANGRYHKYSDIDIALVSDSFDGIRFLDRIKIMKITLKVCKDIEPMPFNPKKFTMDDPFVREIMETGIKLKST